MFGVELVSVGIVRPLLEGSCPSGSTHKSRSKGASSQISFPPVGGGLVAKRVVSPLPQNQRFNSPNPSKAPGKGNLPNAQKAAPSPRHSYDHGHEDHVQRASGELKPGCHKGQWNRKRGCDLGEALLTQTCLGLFMAPRPKNARLI